MMILKNNTYDMTNIMTNVTNKHMDDTVDYSYTDQTAHTGQAQRSQLQYRFRLNIYTLETSWEQRVAPPPFKNTQFQSYQSEHTIYDPINKISLNLH